MEEEIPGDEDGGAALVELELELAGAGGGIRELVPLHAAFAAAGHHHQVHLCWVAPDDIEHLPANLECVPGLASHELEGAVEEGSGVAEGGAVVVDDHNVEELGLASHGDGGRESGGGARARRRRDEDREGSASDDLNGPGPGRLPRSGHATNWLLA